MNRSDNTVTSYVESVHQADAYLTAHGRTLLNARRSDLEDFLADLLSRPTGKRPAREVLVLGHEVAVLCWQVARSHVTWSDRAVFSGSVQS